MGKRNFSQQIGANFATMEQNTGALRNVFRLTRPLNLLIVLITMVIMRYAVMHHLMDQTNIGMKFRLSIFEFMLLIIVALAATAGGNIINAVQYACLNFQNRKLF